MNLGGNHRKVDTGERENAGCLAGTQKVETHTQTKCRKHKIHKLYRHEETDENHRLCKEVVS